MIYRFICSIYEVFVMFLGIFALAHLFFISGKERNGIGLKEEECYKKHLYRRDLTRCLDEIPIQIPINPLL